LRKRSPKRSIACSIRRISIMSLPMPRIIEHSAAALSRAPARPS
jgi:hypothetical protein